MAAQEYTLTRGADTVTTSSPATRDYLLTQGWTTAAQDTVPLGPASRTALEERVYTLENDALYGHDLLPNEDFSIWDTATEPRSYSGFWSSGTTASRDMDAFQTGNSSWKVTIPAVGNFHRHGTQRFTVRPQDLITVRWWGKADSLNQRWAAQLQTSDGQQDPNFFGVDIQYQDGASFGPAAVDEWQMFESVFQVPRGHRLARIYISSQMTAGTNVHSWLDRVKVYSTTEPQIHLAPGWIAPTLNSPFVNYGSTWETAGYTKRNGIVYLRGLLNLSAAAGGGTVMFNVPQGYRPNSDKHMNMAVGVSPWTSLMNVMASGDVRINQPVAAGCWVSLANISWPVDG